ncbi:MAG: heparinase II/III family protein, partial [Armatimonadota bacterium]
MMAGSVLALVLLLPAGCVCAAPIVQVIDDFEGESPPLHPDAQIIEIDGNHVLRWQPTGNEPLFLNYDYRGRGVEMVEWDRLRFRYRIEAERVEWWGVKIVDHPLVDGLQAPYQIAPEQVVLGEWAEAAIDLAAPQGRWGETPSESAQSITFRASGVRGEAPVFLIDDVRVERTVLRLSAQAAGTVRREAEGWSRQFTVTVRNAGERLLRVSFGAATPGEGARLIPPAPVEVAVGAEQRLSARLIAPAQAEPLSLWRAVLAATSDDEDHAEVEMTMSIPLGEVTHPCLLLAKDDIPRIRTRIEQQAWAREAWERIRAGADGWLAREVALPDRGGQWSHWYTCEKCGGALRTVSPTQHQCRECGATYTGWPYDDVVIGREHHGLSNAVRDLGLVYALTGESVYAAKAREILLGYAQRYLTYPLHNIRGEATGGAVHVGAQPLDEATWLIPLVQGFDCIWDALSEDDRRAIADGVLLPAAELVRGFARSIHNIPCWENAAYGLVGIALGNEELAAQAVNGRFGFRSQVAEGVNDDGQWYEGSWGYHYYTMGALEPLAIAAEHVGIDLYSDRYLSMFVAPVRMMAPNGALPAFNDSGRTAAVGRGALYENAYAHWPREELALVIGSGGRGSMQALLYGADEVPAATSHLASQVFPATGVAILRTDVDARPEGVVAGVPANYVALDYGPHGGGHGHPDKLGFELYVLGRLVATDPGSIAYGNPAHAGWYKQTLSHNTVVVDGASQQPTEGRLLFAASGENLAMAGAESDGAYEGVMLRRVMALLPEGLLDLTLALADEEHLYEWAYHSRGEFATELPLAEWTLPAEGPWSWAESPRSAGPLSAWSARWRVDDGLTVVVAQK